MTIDSYNEQYGVLEMKIEETNRKIDECHYSLYTTSFHSIAVTNPYAEGADIVRSDEERLKLSREIVTIGNSIGTLHKALNDARGQQREIAGHIAELQSIIERNT